MTKKQPPIPTDEHRARWQTFFRKLSPALNAEKMSVLGQMRMLTNGMRRRTEQSFEHSSISEAQFRILMHLLFSEQMESTAGLNPSELSRREGTNRNSISSLIRSLEKGQFIVRELDQNDRRKFNILLSDKGRDLVHTNAHAHISAVNSMLSVLDEEEMRWFGRILQKLNAHNTPWD